MLMPEQARQTRYWMLGARGPLLHVALELETRLSGEPVNRPGVTRCRYNSRKIADSFYYPSGSVGSTASPGSSPCSYWHPVGGWRTPMPGDYDEMMGMDLLEDGVPKSQNRNLVKSFMISCC